MTAEILERWKPSARARTQVIAAAGLWSIVGTGLAAAGLYWVTHGPPWAHWAAIGAVLVGLLKSGMVLDRAAVRIVDRIEERGDGRCLGGFLSWKTWLLVAVMMGSGRLLRGGLIPTHWVGLLYVGVGVALVRSSRIAWRRWSALRPDAMDLPVR